MTPPEPERPETLTHLLAQIRPRDGDTAVSVRDMMQRFGERSFVSAILVPALILISPISAIPGTPTIGALIILLIAIQAVFGRQHLWLPGFLMRRSLSPERLEKGLDWLEKPVAWVDRHTKRRFSLLTRRPLSLLVLLTIMATVTVWPFLELLPLVTTTGAAAVSLFAIGLLTNDGAFIVAGYVFLGGLVTGLLTLLNGVA
ncbi:MAG: exopolysaccharide biosynthesis protein [Paracoccaceae bacterium]|nr:exopolysaccharide biosynthesis protein [Paracoccaceae bacterium]